MTIIFFWVGGGGGAGGRGEVMSYEENSVPKL